MGSIKLYMRLLIGYILHAPLRPAPFALGAKVLRLVRIIPRVEKCSRVHVKRVLVVSLTKFVGDAVMMLPLLDMLHDANPEIEIDVAVATQIALFLREVHYLRRVHGIRTGSARIQSLRSYVTLWSILNYARVQMREMHYDICLLPRWGTDPYLSSYLAYLTDAPVRCGNDPREEHEAKDYFRGSERLLTIAVKGGHGLPDAVRQLRLLPACGLTTEFDLSSAATHSTKSLQQIAGSVDWEPLCERLGIDPQLRYGVVAPGASKLVKMWPSEKFSEVILRLCERSNILFLVIGVRSEQAIGEEIVERSRGAAISIVGLTSIAETTAILSRASLFVGNDSGTAHIAAGVGTPTVVISIHPKTVSTEVTSSPARVRPVGPSHTVVQPDSPKSPCIGMCRFNEAHCILGVTTEAVHLAVERVMALPSACSACLNQR